MHLYEFDNDPNEDPDEPIFEDWEILKTPYNPHKLIDQLLDEHYPDGEFKDPKRFR